MASASVRRVEPGECCHFISMYSRACWYQLTSLRCRNSESGTPVDSSNGSPT
ncbi:hypothetical protein QFZ56_004591 [Streptomyces achromogenes]|uniref:Uncharacterized protein n=1 Tax=Streptomyces achromogenes TaxID=67255 RepID=A0ABU0Q4N5_STRAH|nr:hypothetical protein [Streptomyces achromogenes]